MRRKGGKSKLVGAIRRRLSESPLKQNYMKAPDVPISIIGKSDRWFNFFLWSKRQKTLEPTDSMF